MPGSAQIHGDARRYAISGHYGALAGRLRGRGPIGPSDAILLLQNDIMLIIGELSECWKERPGMSAKWSSDGYLLDGIRMVLRSINTLELKPSPR